MPDEKKDCQHLRTGTCQEPVKGADGVEVMQIVRQHCLDCGEVLIDNPPPKKD